MWAFTKKVRDYASMLISTCICKRECMVNFINYIYIYMHATCNKDCSNTVMC